LSSDSVSQSLYTIVAHKFLSIIVYQVLQSQVIEISPFAWSQNIQAPHNVHSITVQLDVGATNSFLNGRIECQLGRVLPSTIYAPDDEISI
jgi:lipoprotein signal peptidase